MFAGFIPYSRATFVFDCIVVALGAVILALGLSLYLVKTKRAYDLHKKIQLTLGLALTVILIWFEIDIRLYGWQHLAVPSPYYSTILFPVLYVHIGVAGGTVCLWGTTLWLAWRKFPVPARPTAHSSLHRKLGKFAACGLLCTALTGWGFYWMAFVA